MEFTTVRLERDLVECLKESREYPRQTYNELIRHMFLAYQKVKGENQYDEFLHKVQQEKMREVWDNPEDEAWEDV